MNLRHPCTPTLLFLVLLFCGSTLHAQKIKDLIAKSYYDKTKQTESIDSALKYLKQAETRLKEIGDLKDLPIVYDLQSACMVEIGKPIEALKTSLVGLQLAERYRDPGGMKINDSEAGGSYQINFPDAA